MKAMVALLVVLAVVVGCVHATCPRDGARYTPMTRLQSSWNDVPVRDVVAAAWAVVSFSQLPALVAQGLSVGDCVARLNNFDVGTSCE